jgi:hypothetical protein
MAKELQVNPGNAALMTRHKKEKSLDLYIFLMTINA